MDLNRKFLVYTTTKRLPVFLPIEIYIAGTIKLFRKPLAVFVNELISQLVRL